MTKFTVKLAGIAIGISALYESTREAYRDYLTTEAPLFTLDASEQESEEDRSALSDRGRAELEKQWLYRRIGERLPAYGALLFHGSAVAVDGSAYLFTAPSGTGKSTHARLWRQVFGDRAVMINDDKPLLKFEENTVLVCGSPWRGKHRLGSSISAPLAGICLLEQAGENSIEPVSEADAFPALLQQCYRSEDPQRTVQTLTLLDLLTQRVAIYRLRCNMEPQAAQIAYDGIRKAEHV